LTVYAKRQKAIPLGWIGYKIFDYKGTFNSHQGAWTKIMWMHEKANPIATTEQNWDAMNSCMFTIQLPTSPLPIAFPPALIPPPQPSPGRKKHNHSSLN